MANANMDRSFLTANIDDVLDRMSLTEKITLLGGEDWWRTVAIPRLAVPS